MEKKIKPLTFQEVITGPLGRCISWYLMTSYLYYEMDTEIISDDEFNQLCEHLLKHLREVKRTRHPHRHLIERDALKAGSGYHLTGKYPLQVIHAATLAYQIHKGKK